MTDKSVLALTLPYIFTVVLYNILRFIYSVIITVAVFKDAKRRTFNSVIIAFLTFIFPIPASVIYIIYVYSSARNDPNIVKVQFDKSFKKLLIIGYLIAVIDAFLFVLSIISHGVGALTGMIFDILN